MAITIRSIAEEANVSRATVSRVINNSPLVRKKTREQVLRVIAKYNYHPHALAQALKSKKSFTIGLIVTDITYAYFPQIIQGIEEVAVTNGFGVFFCESNMNAERERMDLRILLEKRVDGIIAAAYDGPGNNEKLYQSIVEEGIPVVFCNNSLENVEADTVVGDNVGGVTKAIEHLIRLGHKRIGFIRDVFERRGLRELGYRNVFKSHNLKIDEQLIVMRDIEKEGVRKGIGDPLDGYTLFKGLWKLKKPTAVFCSNDAIAFGVYHAADELGLKIPDDLAVVGFDDVPMAEYLLVPLTSVRQPMFEIGMNAFQLLMDRFKNQPKRSKQQILLDTELIIRKSCGAYKNKEFRSEKLSKNVKISFPPIDRE